MGAVEAYLLDIEGTTTPIDFVTKTLFPFAREELREFVCTQDISTERKLLSHEHEQDVAAQNDPPPWTGHTKDEIVSYLEWLMDRDRKSTGLKSIQGRIWESGYASGKLKGVVYPDVTPAFKRWKSAGKKIAIYSSGSVLAQKLIFGHLETPLSPLIDAYFDTELGGKRDSKSYAEIASRLGIDAANILFLSDITEEVQAARSAGMRSIQVFRDGNASGDGIANFDSLD